MEQIRSTEIGPGLLRAIEGAGPEVLILKAGQNVGNTCVQALQTEPASDAACYQEVLSDSRLRAKIQDLITRNLIQQGHPAVLKYTKFFGPAYTTQVRDVSIPLAHNPKSDRPHSTDETLKDRILTFDDRVKEGIGLVRYLQGGLVAPTTP